jgi:hypothetical protein
VAFVDDEDPVEDLATYAAHPPPSDPAGPEPPWRTTPPIKPRDTAFGTHRLLESAGSTQRPARQRLVRHPLPVHPS